MGGQGKEAGDKVIMNIGIGENEGLLPVRNGRAVNGQRKVGRTAAGKERMHDGRKKGKKRKMNNGRMQGRSKEKKMTVIQARQEKINKLLSLSTSPLHLPLLVF